MTMPFNQFGSYNPIYNPNLTPQQRLMQYDNMQMQQTQTVQPNLTNGLICNQVTNIQEAQAYQVPLGAIGVFVDLSTSKIYVKKPLGNDGKPEFNTYTIEQSKPETDLETRISELEKRVTILEKYPINKKKNEVKDVE